jgi:hypothetical protein
LKVVVHAILAEPGLSKRQFMNTAMCVPTLLPQSAAKTGSLLPNPQTSKNPVSIWDR